MNSQRLALKRFWFEKFLILFRFSSSLFVYIYVWCCLIRRLFSFSLFLLLMFRNIWLYILFNSEMFWRNRAESKWVEWGREKHMRRKYPAIILYPLKQSAFTKVVTCWMFQNLQDNAFKMFASHAANSSQNIHQIKNVRTFEREKKKSDRDKRKRKCHQRNSHAKYYICDCVTLRRISTICHVTTLSEFCSQALANKPLSKIQ